MGKRFLPHLMVAILLVGGFAPLAFAESPETIALYEGEAASEWVAPTVALNANAPVGLDPSGTEVAFADPYVTTPSAVAQPDTEMWLAQAEAAEAEAEPAADAHCGLEISVSADWVSKYMFRGYDVLDDSGAYQPSVDIGLWDTGFHLNWWASYASGDRSKDPYSNGTLSRRDLDEHDYTAYWGGSICDAIDVELGFIYYDFIHLDSTYDYFEGYGTFTLSSLPLSPYFGAYYGWPKHSSVGGEGWNTTMGVSHSVPLCGLTVCGSDPLTLDLAADVWYNGGQYAGDTGWSHSTFGASTTIPLPCNFEFTPGVYYQLSMEDTINDEDEWWATLSLAYTW